MRASPAVVAIVVALAFATGCDTTSPQSGAIRVLVTTSGVDLDLDGYRARVDSQPDQTLEINSSTVIVGLRVGRHVVRLQGLEANCQLDGDSSRPIDVLAADTVTAAFTVNCSSLIGSVRVFAITAGFELDPDGYTFKIDDGESRPIDGAGSVLIENLRQGLHTLTLDGFAPNCIVLSYNPLIVTVTYALTTDVYFNVYCKWRPGSLRVHVSTTGDSLDASGYMVVIASGALPRRMRVDATGSAVADFDSVDVGEYSVSLEDLAGNCLVSGSTTRRVAVATRQTTEISYAVDCTRLGDLQLRSVTTGIDPDPNGYQVTIARKDFGRTESLAANATVTVKGLLPGDYSLTLAGAAMNCEPSSTSAKTASVVGGATVDAVFDVACAKVTQLAFWSQVNNHAELHLVNSNGTNLTRLTPNSGDNFEPSWSPDGSKIAFRSSRDGNSDIYVMSVSISGPETRLTNHVGDDYDPAWSPDGAKIAFVSNREGSADVYVMNADGSNVVRLTTQADAFDGEPTWSPDGSKIAFRSDRAGNPEIFVMNANGSVVTRLTTNNSFDGHPAWSPDGTKIAFTREVSSDYYYYYSTHNIFVMNADGSNVTGLASATDDSQPTWSPDGRWIAFATGQCDYYGCSSAGLTAMRPNGTDRVEILNVGVGNPAWRR